MNLICFELEAGHSTRLWLPVRVPSVAAAVAILLELAIDWLIRKDETKLCRLRFDASASKQNQEVATTTKENSNLSYFKFHITGDKDRSASNVAPIPPPL